MNESEDSIKNGNIHEHQEKELKRHERQWDKLSQYTFNLPRQASSEVDCSSHTREHVVVGMFGQL